jgi:hypothetical protein
MVAVRHQGLHRVQQAVHIHNRSEAFENQSVNNEQKAYLLYIYMDFIAVLRIRDILVRIRTSG